MGEPVKILTLAENLIRLSGFVPYKDIDIKFTGLRPGEKLYEELLVSEEGLSKTLHDKIMVTKIMDFDGYRIEFQDWWFNVRPSNTEPYLRLLMEAKNTELLQEKMNEAKLIINNLQ